MSVTTIFNNTLPSLRVIHELFNNILYNSLTLYHVAGVSRRQVQNCTKMFKNINIVEFHYHIWNHNEKYIPISTNMPGIGLVIREINVNIHILE